MRCKNHKSNPGGKQNQTPPDGAVTTFKTSKKLTKGAQGTLNVAPSVVAGPDQQINEGGSVSLTGAGFTDPGQLDTEAGATRFRIVGMSTENHHTKRLVGCRSSLCLDLKGKKPSTFPSSRTTFGNRFFEPGLRVSP